MARQGNILSFDEVKETAGRTRPSVAAPKNSTAKPKKRNSAKFGDSSSTKTRAKQSTTSKSKGKKTAVSKPSTKKSVSASRDKAAGSARPATKKSVSAKLDSGSSSRKQTAKRSGGKQATTSRREETKATQKSKTSTARSSGKISKFSEVKRSLSKSKAGREFTKQFGETTAAAATGGPRAAVYKGEMGPQHKKATRMQGGESAKGGFFSRFSFGGFDFRNSPKLVASLTIVVCLVLSGAFLYPAAQQYYVTVREYDQVQAEYAAIQSRNDEIQSQVDSLSSPEGVEDRARTEFGWVKEGEKSITVYGLDLEDENEEDSYPKSVPSGSIEAPVTWYSPFLDTIFGVGQSNE